jgi:hypothetical protein
VSGYTKRMMEIAAEWLVANPDPASPFISVPGLDKNAQGRALNRDKLDLERYRRIAREVPAVAPHVEELLRKVKEVDEARGQLHEAESALEQHLAHAPVQGHQKYEADDVRHADVGRWCLPWARQGYNVFDLSPDFTAAMLLTDAREMDISDVRLPFSAMLFMISDGFATGAEGTSYTKIHITELPRRDRSMLEARDTMVDALKALSPTQVSSVLHNAQKMVDAPPPSKGLLSPPAQDPSDTMIHIYASDNVRVLDTWIDRKGLTWDAFDALPDDVTEDADKAARHALRQIVFGAIAYMNAVEGSMEPRFQEPKKPPNTTKARAKHWTIGRTIKIDPKLVEAVRLGSREVAFRLKHRHIVRGHYRNQAHGPARSLRTQKWISPYWKGPTDGAALVHTYKLDEPTSEAKE